MTKENIVKHQFKPGQSGNPKGRPKGSGVTDQLKALLAKEVDGQPIAEAIAKVIMKRALKGDYKFVKEILDRVEGKVTDNVKLEGEMRMVHQRFVLAAEEEPGDGDKPSS